MTTDFDKPVNTTDYADVWEYVRDNITDVATWFDSVAGSNIPTDAKRFANNRFEYWSGAAWLELLARDTMAYDIRAAVADLADTATTATTAGACSGNAATATQATSSLQLGGVAASSYTKNTDIRPTDYGGTGSHTVSGARSNLVVYSKTEGDARYCEVSKNLSDVAVVTTARTNLSVYSKAEIAAFAYAPLASPALTGNPTVPTQTAGDNSTKAASTAFVQAALVFSYTITQTIIGANGTTDISAPSGYTFCAVRSVGGLYLRLNSISTSGETLNVTAGPSGEDVRVVWMKHS